MKMGSCKHRRGANIPSTVVKLNINAGMIAREADSDVKVAEVSVEAPRIEKKNTPGVFFSFVKPK